MYLTGKIIGEFLEKKWQGIMKLDQQSSWERQYVKYKQLKPLIYSLEEQINEEK